MNRYEYYANLQAFKKQKEENNVLKHYGIIGQKWGTRRWQNTDGTFNQAGKERYFGSGKSKEQKINGTYYWSENKHIYNSDYQNHDGSLTKRGKKLLDKYENGDKKAAKKMESTVDLKMYDEFKEKNIKEDKMGSMVSFSRKVKKNFNKGVIANHHRKKMVDDILKNREDYDAVNLSDDEIRELVKKIEFPGGQGDDWVHDAQQQFKHESLKYQLEKKLNTKFGSMKNNENEKNNNETMADTDEIKNKDNKMIENGWDKHTESEDYNDSFDNVTYIKKINKNKGYEDCDDDFVVPGYSLKYDTPENITKIVDKSINFINKKDSLNKILNNFADYEYKYYIDYAKKHNIEPISKSQFTKAIKQNVVPSGQISLGTKDNSFDMQFRINDDAIPNFYLQGDTPFALNINPDNGEIVDFYII